MSITDELREYAGNFYLFRYKDVREKLDAIADRIDTEYQKAIRELNNLAEASVLLPVDADGVPIRVGDVMEWIDLDGEVTVTCSVDAVGVDCFFAWDKGNRRYAQKCANAYRHHHVPTVEDVLREFTDEVWNRCCEGATASDSGIDGLVAEYAAKLRLADDGEGQQ